MTAFADIFSEQNDDGVTIYYGYNKSSTTVYVTSSGSNSYSGIVNIPATITHNDTIYQVTIIRQSAFAGLH